MNKSRLLADRVYDDLTTRFAIYLAKYPDVSIFWRRRRLEHSLAIQESTDFELPQVGDPAGRHSTARIIEWKIKPQRRELLVCDSQGVHRMTLNPGVQTPGFEFTAYGAPIAGHIDESACTILSYLRGAMADVARAVAILSKEPYPLASPEQ